MDNKCYNSSCDLWNTLYGRNCSGGLEDEPHFDNCEIKITAAELPVDHIDEYDCDVGSTVSGTLMLKHDEFTKINERLCKMDKKLDNLLKLVESSNTILHNILKENTYRIY